MSNSRLAKLRKQPDATWSLLQKRLISLPDPFESLFPDYVWSFIEQKAASLSTNAGYVATSLLTTTAFVAGMQTTLVNGSQEMPLNLYSVFVGPPTTGKSQALKECAVSPMSAVAREQDSSSSVINKCTSSGLVKTIAANEKGYLLSAEIYDVLFKLLKSDEENATGDVQVLCQLFSGEQTSYRYATESSREIAENTPFCILGSTQVPFAARLFTVLDQGHGLLDRFLITFPKCLRPKPQETEQAIEYLKNLPLASCDDIFVEIARLHSSRATYSLNEEARHLLNIINEEFITEVNAAISEGRNPPKTKKVDIVLRVAVSLHVLNAVTDQLLQGQEPQMPGEEIERSTLEKAISYVSWAESQKEIFVEFLSELITPTLDEEKPQPTKFAIKTACVLFPGPVFTFRAFKQSATRSLRAIAEAEFRDAITILEVSGLGKVCSLRIPRTANPVTVFVKNDPDSITWPSNLCSQAEFRQRYNLPPHRSVTNAIKTQLESKGYVPSGFFTD